MILTAYNEDSYQSFKNMGSTDYSKAIKKRPLAFINKMNNLFYLYDYSNNEYTLINKGDVADYVQWLSNTYEMSVTEKQIKDFYGI